MPLVDTATAAHALGKSAGAFRVWAHRNGLEPVSYERRGRRTVALYELDDVYRATSRHAVPSLPAHEPPAGV